MIRTPSGSLHLYLFLDCVMRVFSSGGDKLLRDRPSLQAVFTVLPVRLLKAAAALARPHKNGGLQGDQLFDMLCVLIFAVTLSFLRLLPAGTIYFWLKDLTQEFLKLHVVHSAVEIFDKVIVCQPAVGRLIQHF